MTEPLPTQAIRASVVVPVYNAQRTLETCLSSLCDQTLPRDQYEIVVVDDGSTDRSPEIARQYRVRQLVQANQGPAVARNAGARIATGEVVLFTDSDCVPTKNWIEEMVRPFDDPSVVGVAGVYRTTQRSLAARFSQTEFEDRYRLMSRGTAIDFLATYSAGLRRSVFQESGGFDHRFPVANNEDTELSYRLSQAGHRMVFNPAAIVYHRHPPTFRKYFMMKIWRAYWRIVVYRRYPGKAVKDTYTPPIVKLQTLAMMTSFALLPIAAFSGRLLPAILVLWLCAFLSSLPFARRSFTRDRVVGLIAPFVVFLRSISFAIGSALGILRCIAMQIVPDARSRSHVFRRQ